MSSLSTMGNLPLHHMAVLFFAGEIKKRVPSLSFLGNISVDCRWFVSLG